MIEKEFIRIVQQKVAVSAVGPSALRGQGVGVLHATQAVLQELDFFRIPDNSNKEFVKWLDQKTNIILRRLPVENNPWGAARKALNLFLRDVFYNRYLYTNSNIQNVENWLEIPLDSAVAKGLKQNDLLGTLPKWPGLKHLSKKVSNKYQTIALKIAQSKDISRVHLDMIFWLENR